MAETHDITRILGEVERGEDGAMDRLMERVHDDLADMRQF